MKFTLLLMIAGILVLAGTAGASDRNSLLPIEQFLAQSLVGLGLFSWGVARSRSHMDPGR